MIVPEPAEIQRYTEEILRRPEFNATVQKPHTPGWLQRALEWLASHPLSLGDWSIGKILLIGVGAALAIVLVLWLVRFLRSGALRPAHTERAPGDRRAAELKPVTARESLGLARGALAAGDERRAIQALLRACLDHLAALGAITLERWKTNTTYLGECPSSLPSYRLFHDLAAAHNDIVYAQRSVAPERIGAMMDLLAGQIETA